MKIEEFPWETLVPFEGQDEVLGQIVISKTPTGLVGEVNIVFSESFKILRHVAQITHSTDDPRELLNLAMARLSAI